MNDGLDGLAGGALPGGSGQPGDPQQPNPAPELNGLGNTPTPNGFQPGAPQDYRDYQAHAAGGAGVPSTPGAQYPGGQNGANGAGASRSGTPIEDASTPTKYLGKHEVTTLALGTVLASRYRIESVIGLGGMGAVYKVRDLHFADAAKYCALKEMIAKFSDESDQRTRYSNFQREANILASLGHPSIPDVHDYFVEHSRAYLVLEFVEGRDLEALLKDTQGLFTEQLVGAWAIQLCDVLYYLHTHKPPIIFRDLKPSNVILTPQDQIVLIDFGIAKTLLDDRKGTMVGTEGYSPPEQYRGTVSSRSDIYSLGAMMHQLLTRSDPRYETPFTFAERLPTALNPSVSPMMEAVIMRCVEYDPEQRYADVLELRAALADVLREHLLETGHISHIRSTNVIPADDSVRGMVGAGRRIGVNTGGLAEAGLSWKFQTGDEVRSSPVVEDGRVFIGSYDRHLYALDAQSGEPAWRFATEGGICGTPATWKHLVITGSEDFNIYGIDAATGQEAWTYRTWQQVRGSPRVHGEAVYIGSDDGFLHALEPRGGRTLWKYRAWRPVRSSTAYGEGLVYFGSDDERLYAVDALTGDEKWRFTAIAPIRSSPALGNGLIYFGSMDFCVYALDAKMGWVAWRERTQNFVVSSPWAEGDRVYIGSVDQHLYCLDGRSGRVVWKFRAGGQINSSPALENGVLYVGCIDGAVYALDAATGRQRWRYQTGGPVPSSPAVANGLVYVGSMDGCVYALRA
jgi:outer membrane protein assembly factor BamB/tRNA A-37 threonylcarbamoyl transferase component Bud32